MGDYYDVRGMKRILAISVGEFNALDPLPNSQIDKVGGNVSAEAKTESRSSF